MRAGGLPVGAIAEFRRAAARRPHGRGSPCAAPCRAGLSVQRATQSMKSRNGWLSGGQSRIAATDLRLSPPPSRTAQTTPVAWRVPSGTPTKSPGSSVEFGGHAIAVGGVDRDRDEHVDDDGRAGRHGATPETQKAGGSRRRPWRLRRRVRSQAPVGAVAVGRVLGVLAAAEPGLLGHAVPCFARVLPREILTP